MQGWVPARPSPQLPTLLRLLGLAPQLPTGDRSHRASLGTKLIARLQRAAGRAFLPLTRREPTVTVPELKRETKNKAVPDECATCNSRREYWRRQQLEIQGQRWAIIKK